METGLYIVQPLGEDLFALVGPATGGRTGSLEFGHEHLRAFLESHGHNLESILASDGRSFYHC